MEQLLIKFWNFLRRHITYQHILLSLLLLALVLAHFCWPTLYSLFEKKQNYSLEIPNNTIPFLLIEREDKNVQFNSIFLAFWDIEQGKIYRDDSLPICEATGDIGQLFWTGNKQIFLCPANERGNVSIISQNPEYQVLVKPIDNSIQSIIKPSYDGKKVYEVSVNSQNGNLKIAYQTRKKNFVFETSNLEGYPEFKLVKPIFFIPNNQNPVIFCFFELKNKPNSGLGVIEGTLYKSRISWKIWKEYDENIKLDTVSYSNFYNNEMVISIAKSLHIDQLTDKKEVRDLNAANNYLSMFHTYLFGSAGSKGFMDRQGLELTEQSLESTDIQVFGDYLLLNWMPNFISNKEFYIRQVIAIKGSKTAGRIEIMDNKIRLYQDSLLVSEELGDKRYLSTRWIFPNE
jgi:hypothetical protein